MWLFFASDNILIWFYLFIILLICNICLFLSYFSFCLFNCSVNIVTQFLNNSWHSSALRIVVPVNLIVSSSRSCRLVETWGDIFKMSIKFFSICCWTEMFLNFNNPFCSAFKISPSLSTDLWYLSCHSRAILFCPSDLSLCSKLITCLSVFHSPPNVEISATICE